MLPWVPVARNASSVSSGSIEVVPDGPLVEALEPLALVPSVTAKTSACMFVGVAAPEKEDENEDEDEDEDEDEKDKAVEAKLRADPAIVTMTVSFGLARPSD